MYTFLFMQNRTDMLKYMKQKIEKYSELIEDFPFYIAVIGYCRIGWWVVLCKPKAPYYEIM